MQETYSFLLVSWVRLRLKICNQCRPGSHRPDFAYSLRWLSRGRASAGQYHIRHLEETGVGGGPRRIRTPDPLIRSQVLYPAELSVRERSI